MIAHPEIIPFQLEALSISICPTITGESKVCREASTDLTIQSMVRDDGDRTLLFQLDTQIQALSADKGAKDPVVISLTGIYHNMLRKWADA